MLDGIEIDVTDPYRDSAKLNYLRGIIFGGEQGISFKDEYASEAGSIFILAQHEGEPVGLIRFRPFKDFAKLERMGVLPKYRKTDLASRIFKKALDVAGMMGYDKGYGICEKELIPYWQEQGFSLVVDAPPLHLTNKTFYAITLPIHVPDNHVRITDHPDRINAPVGHWAEYDERKQQSSAVNKQNKPGVSNLTPEEAKQTMLLKIKHAKLYETKY